MTPDQASKVSRAYCKDSASN